MPPYASARLLAQLDSGTSSQIFLANGGRILLTVAMALFLSYVLFMLGSVVVSVAAGRVRSAMGGPAHQRGHSGSREDARRGGRLTIVEGTTRDQLPAPDPALQPAPEARRTGT